MARHDPMPQVKAQAAARGRGGGARGAAAAYYLQSPEKPRQGTVEAGSQPRMPRISMQQLVDMEEKNLAPRAHA